jgi:hypothetical protein
VDEHTYLVRYGVMGHVARFPALAECDTPFERGQFVVIQTERGLELGEILIPLGGSAAPGTNGTGNAAARPAALDSSPVDSTGRPRVLRMAAPDDVIRSRHAEAIRTDRFALCQRVLHEEDWPWELIDVEPLLDGRSAVLHYLGPPQLEVASLRARFRVAYDLDVVLEPVGTDQGGELEEEIPGEDHHGGGCGNCGCGDGGGCGAAAAQKSAGDGPATGSDPNGSSHAQHAGCASCGISKLLAARNQGRA